MNSIITKEWGMNNNRLSRTVQEIVACLVKGDYDYLERQTDSTRLTKEEMQTAVNEYPGTLVLPPERSFENIDVIEIEGTAPTEWSGRFDLWTAEDGRSDLTLELNLIENNKELYDVRIDNIHVL